MSNHFTGLSLGPPLGDQRLDLCDLYAFGVPGDPARTVLILNANPNADALHPDASYRINVDSNGDNLTDVAVTWVFSEPAADGSQTFSVFMASGADAREIEAAGTPVVSGADVSFSPRAKAVTCGDLKVFAGSRSDAFFFDYDGIKNLFDTSGARNFTAPISAGSPRGLAWTRTRKPTSSRWRSKCRRPDWLPTPSSASGAGAPSGGMGSSCTRTGPGTRR